MRVEDTDTRVPIMHVILGSYRAADQNRTLGSRSPGLKAPGRLERPRLDFAAGIGFVAS